MNVSKNIPIQGSQNRLMGTDVFMMEEIQNAPIVIYVHGFNGFKDWGNGDLIATQFSEAGFCFIKMNLSHNGTTIESPEDFVDLEAFGQNNYSKELYDVGCILDWICDTSNPYASQVNTNSISLIGHSRGGGISIIKAAEDSRITKLVTWASISECKTPWGNMSPSKIEKWRTEGVMFYSNKRTNQSMPLYFQLYEDYQSNENRLDIEKSIKSLKIPVLICHGRQDPAVPFESAIQLNKWQPNSELFFVDSDHVFGRKQPWLENHLPHEMQQVVDKSIQFLF